MVWAKNDRMLSSVKAEISSNKELAVLAKRKVRMVS